MTTVFLSVTNFFISVTTVSLFVTKSSIKILSTAECFPSVHERGLSICNKILFKYSVTKRLLLQRNGEGLGCTVGEEDGILGDSGTGTSVKRISQNSTGMSNMAAVGEIEDESEENLIRYYFLRGIQYGEIKNFLSEYHEKEMSISTLKRRNG